MVEDNPKSSEAQQPAALSVREFLESTPPGRKLTVNPLAREYGANHKLLTPDIQLYCQSEACQGFRFFSAEDEHLSRTNSTKHLFVNYICRNCAKTNKRYALRIWLSTDGNSGEMMKYGEQPAFGPPVPARVVTLIGPDREFFLKGRSSENQGLGIAAFAYYRRVVENQKARIIEEIIRVAEKIGASKEVLDDLLAAQKETQFSTAVETIKHGIPQTLLIQGHNPLTLLHSALSEGLHAKTDEHCLRLATSIRVVLTDLVERMGMALKDDADLNAAVSNLLDESARKAAARKPI